MGALLGRSPDTDEDHLLRGRGEIPQPKSKTYENMDAAADSGDELVYVAKVLFAPGTSPQRVASSLITHKATMDGKWMRLPGHAERMDEPNWSSHTCDHSIFESHFSAVVPDTHNDNPVWATVHCFALPANTAHDVNGSLHAIGTQRYSRFDGVARSNEGGYHSESTRFHADDQLAWYRGVHDVVLAAISIVEPSWRVEAEPHGDHDDASACDAEVFGWLNASRAHDFNNLHAHPRCTWACVYYVDDGAGQGDTPGTPANSGEEADDELLGALLLQTRPEPESDEFAFLPIRPQSGRLWLFPAHMPHAVMPRAILRAAGDATGASAAEACAAAASRRVPSERSAADAAAGITPTDLGCPQPLCGDMHLPGELWHAEGVHGGGEERSERCENNETIMRPHLRISVACNVSRARHEAHSCTSSESGSSSEDDVE